MKKETARRTYRKRGTPPKCRSCGETQPSEFYESHKSECKSCFRGRRKESNARYKRERYANDPEWAAAERRKAVVRSKVNQPKYKARFPKRVYARDRVKDALKSGKLQKHPCWHCDTPVAEAHHCDYDQPLQVIWLCRRCHKAAHALATKL